MSISLVSSTECRINFVNWGSIELTRKFIRVFLQHLTEKPKWTFWPTQYFEPIKPNMPLEAFGDSSLLPWVDLCGGDIPWYPAHFSDWGADTHRWIAIAGFSAFTLYPSPPTTLCSGVWFMWIAPISSSGWVQSMVCPDRRWEEEDIYSWVQIFIPLASSLRRCFKVVCFSQPKVLGSHGGLLIINFPF